MTIGAPPRPPGRSPRPPGPPPAPLREQLARRRAQGVALRRTLTLLVMSLLAPGSAQRAVGHRRVGTLALCVFAACLVAAVAVVVLVQPTTLAKLAVRPWFLGLVKVLAVLLAAAWALLVLDAWRLGRPGRLSPRARLGTAALAIGLAVVVVAPFLVGYRVAAAQRDLIASVFPSGEAAVASDGRLNILLLGADAGSGRVGLRPDSITLVSIDATTGRPVMFSLPRNLERARFVPGTPAAEAFPDGFAGDGEEADYLLNATYTYGTENPELFPGAADPGLEAVEEAVGGTLGLDVHYYAMVDLTGFRDVVDALGGLRIRVAEDLPIGDKGRILRAGLRTLDGYETLWYARSRSSTSDYSRMARQRCVLNGLLRQADPAVVVRNIDRLARSAKSIVQTDIPLQQLPDLVDLALRARDHDVVAVQFVPPLVKPGNPDIGAIQDKVQDTIAASERSSADEQPRRGTAKRGSAKVTTGGGTATATPDGRAAGDSDSPAPEAQLGDVCSYS